MMTASYSRSSVGEHRREILGQQLAGVGRAAPAGEHVERRRATGGSRRFSSTSPSRTSSSPGVRGSSSSSATRPRRRSQSTRIVLAPARASVAASPNATVVLPWLPSGLVIDDRADALVGEEQVRAQVAQRLGDDAQARIRREVLGRVHLQDRASRRGSPRRPAAPLALARSSAVSTFVVRFSRSRAAPRPRPRPSSAATNSVSLVRGKTGVVGRAGGSISISFSDGVPISSGTTRFSSDSRRRSGAQLRQPRLRAARLDLHDARPLERLDGDRRRAVRPSRCSARVERRARARRLRVERHTVSSIPNRTRSLTELASASARASRSTRIWARRVRRDVAQATITPSTTRTISSFRCQKTCKSSLRDTCPFAAPATGSAHWFGGSEQYPARRGPTAAPARRAAARRRRRASSGRPWCERFRRSASPSTWPVRAAR